MLRSPPIEPGFRNDGRANERLGARTLRCGGFGKAVAQPQIPETKCVMPGLLSDADADAGADVDYGGAQRAVDLCLSSIPPAWMLQSNLL